MRYASIDEYEVTNGIGNGVSLYVQGCGFHCPGCFNQSAWDFNGGKEWTEEVEKDFFQLIDRPYIKRISVLGGEPLENPHSIYRLTDKIRQQYGNQKSIWIFSGYTWDEIMKSRERTKAILNADVLVDGRFEEDNKDLSLKFRGSTNQRVIDIKKSLEKGDIILWNN